MKIYNSSGVEIVDVIVKDDSYRYRRIMGENALTLKFDSFTHIDIPVGSYCDFQGERYTLMKPQNIIEHNTRNFEYTLILESAFSLLGLYKFKDTTSSRLKFWLNEKPQIFLQRLVDNLNARDSGWSVGSYVDSPEKTLSFNHNYCSEAIKMIADAFETEFEVVGKVISLRKVEHNKTTPLALSYGNGNGFKSGVKRDNFDNSKAVEILYVQGGERNIDRSKYGSNELLLPKDATLQYEGRNYITDPLGYYIVNADRPLSSKSEDSLDCTHIYPSRVGEVSEVVVVDAEKNFYDFKDSSIPESLDYSLCRIAGEKAVVKFESGMLAGKEFDIVQTDSALTGYVHAERRFKLVPQEIDGVTMPNDTFKPAIGDKYAVFGIHLPDAYIEDTDTGAEWKMFREAAKYMYENEDPRFSFTGPLDGIWAKQNWLAIGGKIKLGGYVSFTAEFQTTPVLIRIVAIKDYINKPYSPEIELSNVTVGSGFATSLRKLEATEVVIDESKKESIRFAKRGFREVRETSKMLENALLNFSSSINPISVQTMQILLGDNSLQFRFVNSKTTPVEVAHDIVFNTGNKVLTCEGGIIQHMTLGIDAVSSSHAASEYKFWDVPEYNSPALADAGKSYYLYAKVSKSNQTGVFLLSETAIAIESVTGYYHLLVAIVNAEFDLDRSIVPLYGYTEILPGRITTKKIVSPDGSTYFDLENNEIGGNVKFKSGSTYTDVGAGIAGAIATAAADATAKADAAIGEAQGYTDTVKAGLQAQIDGVVDSWFYAYSPTISNYPASEWTTTELKQRHVGDTFTNTQPFVDNSTTPDAGKSWRWVENAGVFSWTQIADSDAVLALQRAAQAQDTADGKRRVFTSQPVTPYNVGDLWSQGTAGDLMKCKTERLTGSYNSADWEKASKYTDDTKANQAWDYADEANANAMAAIDSANTANTLLSNIANDNKLTPDEKQSTKKEWDIIVAEYTPILNQATAFAITTEKTAFTTKYNALSAYITPLLSSLTTTSDITGSVFRLTFAEYYTAKVNLLNAISAKAKQIADDVQNELNGLQVGGENIADRTSVQIVAGAEISKFEFIKGDISATPIQGRYLKNNQAHVLTISESIRTAGTATHYSVVLYDFTQLINTYQQEFAFSGTKQVIKFTTPATGNWSLLIYAGIAGATAGNSVEYKGIMLQEGNKETAYQLALRYLNEALMPDNITPVGTDIGLLFSKIIQMRDSEGVVRSGMSGLAGDNIGFWTGGTYADALAGLAKIILRKDGSGQLAGGSLSWDLLGQLLFGKIGDSETIKISTGAIPDLAEINNREEYSLPILNENVVKNLNNPADAGINVNTAYSQEFTLENDGYLTIDAAVQYTAGSDIIGFGIDGMVWLEKFNGTSWVSVQEGTVYQLFISLSVYQLSVTKGRFRVRWDVVCGYIDVQGSNATISLNKFCGIDYKLNVKKLVIGIDGIALFDSMSDKYLRLSLKDNVAQLRMKLDTDMPGVLLAGDGNAGGGGIIRFGAKRHTSETVEPLGTGYYKVWHSIGHNLYTVQLTMKTAGMNGVWEAPNNDYFIVRTYSGTNPANANFSFVVLGDN